MNLVPGTSSRRLIFAIGISLLLHGLFLWAPSVPVPRIKSSLPPLTARLEALPGARIANPKHPGKPRPAVQQQAAPESALQVEPMPQAVAPAASEEPVAASSPVEAETLALVSSKQVERPPLPRRAQLTFNLSWGKGGGVIGEIVHTLEIDDGHYVLHAVTKSVGLTSLFINYQLSQYSSGSYGKYGLVPERYSEDTKESSGTLRSAVEFDRAAQRARFSSGKEMPLTPDTLDVLSNMYQFPPLQDVTRATVSVSNTKKVEQYEFEIIPDVKIDTALGQLLTVHLRKLHAPGREGLEIWLAREYRLFPVKLRFFNKQGEVSGEAVITDIRVSETQGAKSDAVN